MNAALRQKLDQARMVIGEAFDLHPPESSLIAWSAGKDSTLVLWLTLDVCRQRGLKPPLALDIDQKDQFPELEAFRDLVADKWGVELLIVRNPDFLSRVKQIGDRVTTSTLDSRNQSALRDIGFTDAEIVWQPDSPVCNHLLKTVPMIEAIRNLRIGNLFTGIRWDEHPARESETYISERANPPHARINPILHFTERDIWDTIFALDLPFTDLYKLGYRSLGSRTGTQKNSDRQAWEQDLENTAEREGRSKEKEKMMAQLREWGYI